MSPPPPTPDDAQSVVSGIPPQLKDGVIASVLGGMAMSARMLLSTEPVTFGFVARRFFAASITAMLVGLGTKDYFTSTNLWLAVAGGSGYAAPEVTDYFLKYVKAKGEAKLKEVTGGRITKIPSTQGKAKSSGKRKR